MLIVPTQVILLNNYSTWRCFLNILNKVNPDPFHPWNKSRFNVDVEDAF